MCGEWEGEKGGVRVQECRCGILLFGVGKVRSNETNRVCDTQQGHLLECGSTILVGEGGDDLCQG